MGSGARSSAGPARRAGARTGSASRRAAPQVPPPRLGSGCWRAPSCPRKAGAGAPRDPPPIWCPGRPRDGWRGPWRPPGWEGGLPGEPGPLGFLHRKWVLYTRLRAEGSLARWLEHGAARSPGTCLLGAGRRQPAQPGSPCAGAGGRAAAPPSPPCCRGDAKWSRPGRRPPCPCWRGARVIATSMVQGCNDSRTQSQGQIFCRHPKALCIIVIIALVLLALLLGLCGIPWLHGTPQQNTTTLMPFSSPPNSIAETLFFSSTKLNYSACHNFCQDQGWELLGPDVAQAQQEHYKTTWVQTPSTKDQPWTCYYLEDGEQRESSCTVTRPCHCREASAPASPQN